MHYASIAIHVHTGINVRIHWHLLIHAVTMELYACRYVASYEYITTLLPDNCTNSLAIGGM